MFQKFKHNIKITDIKIPSHFTPPRPEKLILRTLKYSFTEKLGTITIDRNNTLVDGYCTYLIAQTMGIDKVKVKRVKEAPCEGEDTNE